MAEPSSFRVNGLWAGGQIANGGTLGWADVYFDRSASNTMRLTATTFVLTGQIQLANAQTLFGRTTSNALVTLIGTTASDLLEIGDSGLATARFNGKAMRLTETTYASLPTPSGPTYAAISDSNTNVWGATAAGGGANHVLVFYNGADWTVAAK